jgi:hypothetical protein
MIALIPAAQSKPTAVADHEKQRAAEKSPARASASAFAANSPSSSRK